MIYISRALPASLLDLRLGPVILNLSGVESLSQNLPKSLRVLVLSQFVAPQGDLVSLFKVLPKSLTMLNFNSLPASLDSLSMLNSHWPNNLRQLFFQGVKLGDQKIMTLSRNLPPSIERFALMGADMGDLGLAEISKHSLENVHFLEWNGNRFSTQAFNAFMSQKRSLWNIAIGINDQIQDGLLVSVPQENLEMLRALHLDGLRLSKNGLEPILSKLNSNFIQLSIKSTRLTPQGVDAVISALPSNLRSLDIEGIAIGENAKEKFRRHAKEQEDRTGIALELNE